MYKVEIVGPKQYSFGLKSLAGLEQFVQAKLKIDPDFA